MRQPLHNGFLYDGSSQTACNSARHPHCVEYPHESRPPGALVCGKRVSGRRVPVPTDQGYSRVAGCAEQRLSNSGASRMAGLKWNLDADV